MTAAVDARSGVERVLSGVRSALGRFGSGTAADRRSLLWYGLYTVLVFGLCLAVTFPHDLLLQRALRAATSGKPLRIETGAGRVGWTLAYGLDSLRVRGTDTEAEPLLAAEALRFSPSRFGLLRGNPFPVGIDAVLYGGTLRGTIDPRPASFGVDATIEAVDLSRYAGWRPWIDGTVRGKLEGAVTLDGGARGPAGANGTVVLRIPGLTLEGTKVRGITVPDLHFGDVHLAGTVKNGRVEIGELVADGREVVIRGEGNVLLRDPLESSVLSLDLTVTPAAEAPDGLKLAINMLPGSSGEGGARRIGIVGTLARPTVR